MIVARILAALVGLLLLATGFAKALDVPGFIAIAGQYRVLPEAALAPAAVLLIAAELGLGTWLLSGRALRAAGVGGLALHCLYFGWAAAALARGLVLENCGCFGVFWPSPLGWTTLAEDGLLILLCAGVASAAVRRGVRVGALSAALLGALPAQAMTLDGVTLPQTVQAAGVELQLNGAAIRTYSVFRVHVYVAGLYVMTASHDGAAIMASATPKLLAVRYLRGVGVGDVHAAWRALFGANCAAPCVVPEAEIGRFLALSAAIRAGDAIDYVLGPSGVRVILNGRGVGEVPGQPFARLLLATFIGAEPTSAEVKRGLLGR